MYKSFHQSESPQDRTSTKFLCCGDSNIWQKGFEVPAPKVHSYKSKRLLSNVVRHNCVYTNKSLYSEVFPVQQPLAGQVYILSNFIRSNNFPPDEISAISFPDATLGDSHFSADRGKSESISY